MGAWGMRLWQFVVVMVMVMVLAVVAPAAAGEVVATASATTTRATHKNAYVAMMYMGTPRDYEFYVGARVMLRSLADLHVKADLVLLASLDVPTPWVDAMTEDGVRVVRVKNMNNPYMSQPNSDNRFKLTLNKLYAWSLTEYERVVMLDSDNLFLRSTDELFLCGQFCAVFINPCIFHTGLFVLQPSTVVFNDMLQEIATGRDNPDGADQGFLGSYFSDLLDKPLFHPPSNGTSLNGHYRLPLGYQMDASYYYLQLRWRIPCGPNSVITFPSALWLKPWYWWSWPVLPLGLSWHEQRRQTIGYSGEIPMLLIQSAMYLITMALTRLARPNMSKLCYRRPEDSPVVFHFVIKIVAIWSYLAAYVVPFFLIPRTTHPVLGWLLYLLGSSALASVAINAFLLPALPVFAPWLGIAGALGVMAYPWYSNGITRALAVFGYAVCCAPVVWASLQKVISSLQSSLDREGIFTRLGDSSQLPQFNKLY